MPIISVKDNKNNRWKGNTKTNKQKRTRGMEAVVKGWERNDFVERLIFDTNYQKG